MQRTEAELMPIKGILMVVQVGRQAMFRLNMKGMKSKAALSE